MKLCPSSFLIDWPLIYQIQGYIYLYVWIPLFLSSWTNEKMLIYANITPTYLLVHFQFQSKCNRSPLYCWEKKTWCYYWAFFIECILSLFYFLFIYFFVFIFAFFSFAELNDIGTFAFCKLIPKLSWLFVPFC
jgi:hypothetical protein